MKRDLHCPYSILNKDIICEHKVSKILLPSTITLHNHDGYEVLLVLRGNISIIVASEEILLKRGDLALIPAYTFHGINMTDIKHYERFVINIKPKILKQLSDSEFDLSECFQKDTSHKLNIIHLDENTLIAFLSILDKLENSLKSSQYGHTILARAYLSEFMVLISNYCRKTVNHSYKNTMSPVVTKIFEYIDVNITKPLTVEKIATALHHNRDYINRSFKNTTGNSLKHYINAKKISLAQQYLKQGYSPYDVCFMIGYNNYCSFSRNFSKQIGSSPKQYQMALKLQKE